jgi:hypothetical protein
MRAPKEEWGNSAVQVSLVISVLGSTSYLSLSEPPQPWYLVRVGWVNGLKQ